MFPNILTIVNNAQFVTFSNFGKIFSSFNREMSYVPNKEYPNNKAKLFEEIESFDYHFLQISLKNNWSTLLF